MEGFALYTGPLWDTFVLSTRAFGFPPVPGAKFHGSGGGGGGGSGEKELYLLRLATNIENPHARNFLQFPILEQKSKCIGAKR